MLHETEHRSCYGSIFSKLVNYLAILLKSGFYLIFTLILLRQLMCHVINVMQLSDFL